MTRWTKKPQVEPDHDWDGALASVTRCDFPARSQSVTSKFTLSTGGGITFALGETLLAWLKQAEETAVFERSPESSSDPVVVPCIEHFELLISQEYELIRPIPIHVYRYDDGIVVIRSMELNLHAEGTTEYSARREFSDILVEELEDLESEGEDNLGVALKIELTMLRRLLRRVTG